MQKAARDIGRAAGIVMESESSSSSVRVAVEVQADTVPADMRKGPWTVEEDHVLVNYIAVHGDGRWNTLARSAGLKRSGKSCRLRWLNYLRPDIRRGNFTPEEQLLILELHSRWGNRWSKIAQHLPGRTDNEIKNYWRTRVQKHAKRLQCDVNSQQFKDAVRYLWMPRLTDRIQANSRSSAAASVDAYSTAASLTVTSTTVADTYVLPHMTAEPMQDMAACNAYPTLSPDHSIATGTPSDLSAGIWSSSSTTSDLTDRYVVHGSSIGDYKDEFPTSPVVSSAGGFSESVVSPYGCLHQGFPEFERSGWGTASEISSENWWAAEDIWFLQQEL